MHERFLLSPSTAESCLHPGLMALNLPRGRHKREQTFFGIDLFRWSPRDVPFCSLASKPPQKKYPKRETGPRKRTRRPRLRSRNSSRSAAASGYVPGYEWNMSVCFHLLWLVLRVWVGEGVGDKGEGGGSGGSGCRGEGGFMSKSSGGRWGGAPRGHGGGSLEEAHTLICHVLVCLGAQKSGLQSPVETQATVWFTAAAQPMCGDRPGSDGEDGGGGRVCGNGRKSHHVTPSDNTHWLAVLTKQTPVSI